MVQYILPCAVEAQISVALYSSVVRKSFYALRMLKKLVYALGMADDSDSAVSSPRWDTYLNDLLVLFHILAIGVSLALIAVSLQTIYFTCVFFHTPLESITGFGIAFIFAFLPFHLGSFPIPLQIS